jgi:hypothetical protein
MLILREKLGNLVQYGEYADRLTGGNQTGASIVDVVWVARQVR